MDAELRRVWENTTVPGDEDEEGLDPDRLNDIRAYSAYADAYEITDPKHPDHYEALVDVWDNREK